MSKSGRWRAIESPPWKVSGRRHFRVRMSPAGDFHDDKSAPMENFYSDKSSHRRNYNSPPM